MPFIGKQPEVGAYQLIDSITTSATATFALAVGGTAYFPASARNLIVSLNGVTQAPESAYTVSGSNIVFDSALTSSDVIDYILVIGDAVDIGTPSDGTVGTAQMSYPLGNFSSTGIDDNADATAITISAAEKVGINNASPSELLSMIGTGGTAKVRFDGDSSNLQNNFIGITGYDDLIIASDEANSGSASTIQFRVDAAERMRIDSNGDVGIGIDNPLYKLQVAGATADADGALGSQAPQFSIQGGNANNQFEFGMDNSGATAVGFIQSRNLASGAQTISLNPAGGSVSIGTTTPDSYNSSMNDLVVARSGDSGITIASGTASEGSIAFADGTSGQDAYRGWINYNHNSNFMRFFANGSEGMRIASNGSVTIPGLATQTSSSSANVVCNNSTGTLLRSTSSRRYKENIVDAEFGLSELLVLRPVNYNSISDDDGDTLFSGLIAEEVHEAGLTTFVSYDDQDRPDALHYAPMISLCVKAIQEQQAIIEDLQTRLFALETN